VTPLLDGHQDARAALPAMRVAGAARRSARQAGLEQCPAAPGTELPCPVVRLL